MIETIRALLLKLLLVVLLTSALRPPGQTPRYRGSNMVLTRSSTWKHMPRCDGVKILGRIHLEVRRKMFVEACANDIGVDRLAEPSGYDANLLVIIFLVAKKMGSELCYATLQLFHAADQTVDLWLVRLLQHIGQRENAVIRRRRRGADLGQLLHLLPIEADVSPRNLASRILRRLNCPGSGQCRQLRRVVILAHPHEPSRDARCGSSPGAKPTRARALTVSLALHGFGPYA
mmetsp:Transcript_109139/g.250363  ORF Transcript_109139/g.250363 Transcript_109139/m.250363 type:complete len:232 (-) Transcript_109139:1824-2519(-)